MAKLKGGRLLLDVREYVLYDEPTIPLQQGQAKAILEKGLSLYLSMGSVDFVKDCEIETIDRDNNEIIFIPFHDIIGEITTDFSIKLSLNGEWLEISIL